MTLVEFKRMLSALNMVHGTQNLCVLCVRPFEAPFRCRLQIRFLALARQQHPDPRGEPCLKPTESPVRLPRLLGKKESGTW